VVESLKIITEKASTRISRFAFEHARKNKRKKIHCIHKANIMKLSDGLFLRCSRAVSKEYPEITYGEHIVDNTCMQLVMNPYQYDMLAAGESLRRHSFRSVRGTGRRTRPGPRRQFRPRVRHLRSRPRLGARHCRKEYRQSHGRVAIGVADAAPSRRADAAWKIRNAIDEVYRDRSKLTRDVGGTPAPPNSPTPSSRQSNRKPRIFFSEIAYILPPFYPLQSAWQIASRIHRIQGKHEVNS
jgi:isocitrate dehydrogenase (NAD+)